jgi:hypothetical protein
MRNSTVLNTADITRIIPAWVHQRAGRASTNRSMTGEPHIRLQVVQDEGHALAVEVVQGGPVDSESMLHLQDRGLFEVAALLRRHGIGGVRVYLRLRACRSRRAA